VYNRERLDAARVVWQQMTPENQGVRDMTQSKETAHRHALEARDKDLLVVHDLEVKLEVDVRWDPSRAEWKAASELVAQRRYQRCLDTLEGLIVARMFELTKMNMSQTGKSNPFVPVHYILLVLCRLQDAQTHC
jgi:hypothetical protein